MWEMIIKIILGIVAAGAAFIYLQLLPPLPAEVVGSIAWVVALPWGLNVLFPIDTIFLILGLMLTIELVLLKLGLITWGLSKIHGGAPGAAAAIE